MNGGKTISHFEVLAMEVQQVLRMNGGDGKTSYTSNSLIQVLSLSAMSFS